MHQLKSNLFFNQRIWILKIILLIKYLKANKKFIIKGRCVSNFN